MNLTFRDDPLHPLQIVGYRKMSVAEKFRLICGMRATGLELRKIGLRMRHPDWPSRRIEHEARKAATYATT